jgi:hypothetical protein
MLACISFWKLISSQQTVNVMLLVFGVLKATAVHIVSLFWDFEQLVVSCAMHQQCCRQALWLGTCQRMDHQVSRVAVVVVVVAKAATHQGHLQACKLAWR